MNDLAKIIEYLPLEKGIETVERFMLGHEQMSCPVMHHFGPGIYVREVTVPAGAVAIGHYQKTAHLNIFLKGRVALINDDKSTSELCAPMIFTAPPGRKVGYVHEDMVWLNVYSTDETDIDTLESMFLDKSQVFLDSVGEAPPRVEDRQDFREFLAEYNLDADVVRQQSENEVDQIVVPFGSYPVKVADSAIEGKGIFATADIASGSIIAPGRLGEFRTIVGRYTNHAKAPNARFVLQENSIVLQAIRDIKGCAGGRDGEEITVDYRDYLRRALCQG